MPLPPTRPEVAKLMREHLDRLMRLGASPEARAAAIREAESGFQAGVSRIIGNDDPEAYDCAVRAFTAESVELKERTLRECLARYPDSKVVLTSLGTLLWSQSRAPDEVERLYRRAYEVDPADEFVINNLATVLLQERHDPLAASTLLITGLSLHPESPFLRHVSAEVAMFEGAFDKCLELAKAAFNGHNLMGDRRIVYNEAEACLTAGAASCVLPDVDDAPALGRFKTLVRTGFTRMPSQGGHQMGRLVLDLAPEDLNFYTKLYDALRYADRVAVLEGCARWERVEPIPVEVKWT